MSIIYLSSIWDMCVCVVCLGAHESTCAHTCVYMCMWKPKNNLRCHFWGVLSMSTLLWDKVSHSPGDHQSPFDRSPPPQCWACKHEPSCQGFWSGFWVFNSDLHAYKASTLPAEPFSLPPLLVISIICHVCSSAGKRYNFPHWSSNNEKLGLALQGDKRDPGCWKDRKERSQIRSQLAEITGKCFKKKGGFKWALRLGRI